MAKIKSRKIALIKDLAGQLPIVWHFVKRRR